MSKVLLPQNQFQGSIMTHSAANNSKKLFSCRKIANAKKLECEIKKPPHKQPEIRLSV